MYIDCGNGVTYAPDTPKNWDDFYRRKERICSGPGDAWQRQLASEAKRIKQGFKRNHIYG